MEIIISLGGRERRFQGDSDTLQNNNWNQIIYHLIEDDIDGNKVTL